MPDASPGSVRTIGVIGGGQLGRMLALAGIPMGFRFVFLDPAPEACAAAVGGLIVAPYDDEPALDRLAASCDVVTCEFENVPGSALRWLARRLPVHPGPMSFEVAQDRLAERDAFRSADVLVAPSMAIEDLAGLRKAIDAIGLPGVLKSRHGGYDGKGQARIHTLEDAAHAWARIGMRPAIYEQFVSFTREISIIGVRSASGEFRAYPLSRNTHHDGILRSSRVPASEGRVDQALQGRAERRVRMLMNELGHVGVLAVEFFVIDMLDDSGDVRLIANEFAPRVHNSGHWTIEGSATSQFANHVRAIAGLPLGDTALLGPVAMLNCIGSMPDRGRVLQIPGVSLHDYGKGVRDGRKVGHLTIRGDDPATLDERVARCEELLMGTSVSAGA